MPLKYAGAVLSLLFAILVLPRLALAQANSDVTPSRITAAVDDANLSRLSGNTHPLAQVRFDQGAAPDALPLRRMLLVLKRSPAQESALDTLLDQQQDSTSPNFHQWLTPQQFGRQFGPSDQDVQTITSWLQSRGFQVAGISNGRTVIEFSGTAGQVRDAFHTTIHRYTVNGEDHWANSSDPQIPAALTPVVAGINTLYNFPRRAMDQIVGTFSRSRETGKIQPVGSQFTITSGSHEFLAVAPADFAKIYSVPNLVLNPPPATVYNGDGQTIAIVGESDINPQDINQFRTLFGLPTPANLNVIVSGTDPGVNRTETEADLDIEWAGAIAPHATIDFVIAEPTEVSLGVDLAAQYAIDNNLAPVLNESFGICEFFMGNTDNVFYNQLWQQAAAQGITVTVSSGDAGSALCDQNAGTSGPAVLGLSVSGFTSTPYNVSVGGTDFNDVSSFQSFWNTQPSDTPTVATALGYIPEMTWNDSCTNQEIFSTFSVASAEASCNSASETRDGLITVAGGSGGASNCTTSDGTHVTSCSGGYAKPSWQTGSGVPNDGKRDIPDISLFASNGFNASFYIVCEADSNPGASSCDPFAPSSDFIGVGGTSASSPAFAAIIALVNQATGSRQGNANYVLYKLAAQTGNTCTSAANPASTCVFYDIPAGSTIAMPCASGSVNDPSKTNSSCPISTSGDTVGVLSGYSTNTGYDLATGLGSVNAANLISKWTTFDSNLKASTTTLTLNSGAAVNIAHGQSVSITVSVSGTGGTPTGNVSLIANTGTGSEQGVASAVLANGTATFSTDSLPGGTNYTVLAQYSGDSVFKASTSATTPVNVSPEPSKIQFAYELLNSATGTETSANASTAVFGAEALLRVNVTSQAGDACAQNAPGNSGCPTGSINITDAYSGATNPLDAGAYPLNAQGYAEDQTIFLRGGQHTLTVSYPGDASFNSCCSPATTDQLTITPAPTTIQLISSQSDVALGGGVTLIATVSSQVFVPSSSFSPSGTVQFFDGAALMSGQVTITPGPIGGTGQTVVLLLTNSLAQGAHSITAKFLGDASYSLSGPSNTVIVNVEAPDSIAVTTSNPSVVAGTSLTFTAQVNPGTSGGPVPTGSIQWTAIGPGIGFSSTPPTGLTNGQAQLTVSTLPAGNLSVIAAYSGDANYQIASGSVAETITAIPTTTTITSSNPSATQGSSVTFTAQISAQQTLARPIGGIVEFTSNGATISFVTIENGQAQAATSSLPSGSFQIEANYLGDAFRSGSSATLTETITPPPSFTAAASPASVTISAPGQSASTTLTFTSQNGLTGSGSLSSSTCGISSTEEITCTLSAFTLPANGSTQATLTFTSTAATAAAPSAPEKPLAPLRQLAPQWKFLVLLALAAFGILMALHFTPRWSQPRWALFFVLVILSTLATVAGCGGGSGGGGGGVPANPGTPAGAVNPLNVSIAINGITVQVPNLAVTVQ